MISKNIRAANSINNVWALTKRNILLFFKNKTTMFFSILAPVLILVIYVLFMGDVQAATVEGLIPEGIEIDRATITGVVNAWMASGVIGIACITVGLNSVLSMVQDKENKAVNDFAASPVNPVNLLLSYFISAVIITFSICLIVLVIVVSYLWIATGVGFSFATIMELLLILLLSCLSAVMIMMCILSFFKTNQASAAFTGVFSALIGFLTGAYFPLGFLPSAIQSVAGLIPGTHATSLFRNIFVGNILNNLPANIPAAFINQIKETYSFNLQLFGATLNRTFMYTFLAGSVVVFFGVYLILEKIRDKKK